MWKLDDVIMYGSNGICRIEDIQDREFAGEIKKYFTLKPIFDDKNTFFVPTFNEALMSRIKPVMTYDEATALIKRFGEIEPEWVDNDKARIEQNKETLESCDRERIVAMLKGLYERRLFLISRGKKLRTSDEILMKNAEQLIENECAYVLGILRSEVRDFIEQNIC